MKIHFYYIETADLFSRFSGISHASTKIFTVIGCYTAWIGSYWRFGTSSVSSSVKISYTPQRKPDITRDTNVAAAVFFLSQVPNMGATLHLSSSFFMKGSSTSKLIKKISEMVDLALVFSAPSHFMHRMCRFYFRVFVFIRGGRPGSEHVEASLR